MLQKIITLPALIVASLILQSCGSNPPVEDVIEDVIEEVVVVEPSKNFITRDGYRLMDGDVEFRFAGIHAPELHRIEDDSKGTCTSDNRGWGQYFKWPTALEQENWIKALTYSGHKAMRVYVLSVETPQDAGCGRETHILKPESAGGMPVLNETAMVHYDQMIALADQYNLRLILPFIDHWKWWGGRDQLAAFYNESGAEFYKTSSKTFAAYKNIIEQVINRKNTITGRLYKDEPAIMAWETGNELKESTEAFVKQTAAHIKSLDSNHLFVDGTYLKVNAFSLSDPNVDIISNHFYTTNNNNNPQQIRKDLEAIGGKKVYMVGEFGLKDSKGIEEIMQAAVSTDVNGAHAAGIFIWGFRGHREEGGYYWHKEYTGHYSYHYPGFAENDSNEEQTIVSITRKTQAQMNGLTDAAALPIPEAPILHSIDDPAKKIHWMGSPLGESYKVERSSKVDGPWAMIGDNISDGRYEFNPETDVIFKDGGSLTSGTAYYYRVIAKNESGESKASNVVEVKLK